MGNSLKGAAEWIGSKIGGGERDVDRAEGDVSGEYNKAEAGVQNFDNQVDQSYDQGEQQGRQ